MFSSRTQPVLTLVLKEEGTKWERRILSPSSPHQPAWTPSCYCSQDVAPSNLWQTWFLWSRKIIEQHVMRSNSRRQKALSCSLSLSHIHTHTATGMHTHTHNMQIYNILVAKHEIRGHMKHQTGTTLILHWLITVLEILFPY